MPQSLGKVILHIICGTKDRGPWLDSNVRPRMYAYLATVCRDLGAEFVHVVVLPITFTLSHNSAANSFRGSIHRAHKKASSKWIKELGPRYRGFFWQRGCGAFSVSPSQLDSVLEYVNKQQEHHRKRTFQEEYRELLRKYGVDFDERYVLD